MIPARLRRVSHKRCLLDLLDLDLVDVYGIQYSSINVYVDLD